MIGELRGAITQPPAAAASLYVGDLNLDVTETLLYEIFNAVGPVASCRICRDAKSKKSLGYGYVNFHNAVDAERAIDTMNFTFIRGRPCRIMWSNRDKTIRDNALGNIVIKNLDKSIDNKTLYDTFSMFGDILSCKVGMDANNESLGYGFVHYSDPKSAEKAIERIHGMVIAEKKVVVENYVTRAKKFDENSKTFTNVYVKNVPLEWTKEEIESKCTEHGEIASILIPSNADGGLRGYCYCDYKEHESAVTAIESLNGEEVGDNGSKLSAERCVTKAELKSRRKTTTQEMQNVNLYIKNLAPSIDDEELQTLFEEYGTITSVKVMVKNGTSRGFGFVNFDDEGSASKAMAEMNGKTIKEQQLYVGLAQPKTERKAMLAKKFSAVSTNPAPQMLPPYARGGFNLPPPPRMGMGLPPMGMGFPRMQMGFPPPPMGPYGMPLRNASMMPPPPPTAGGASGGGLTYDQLAGKSGSEQKQIIGEKLYNRIQQIEPSKAGKITGMLLEMDQTELLHLLEDNESLIAKTKEAVAVLHSVS